MCLFNRFLFNLFLIFPALVEHQVSRVVRLVIRWSHESSCSCPEFKSLKSMMKMNLCFKITERKKDGMNEERSKGTKHDIVPNSLFFHSEIKWINWWRTWRRGRWVDDRSSGEERLSWLFYLFMSCIHHNNSWWRSCPRCWKQTNKHNKGWMTNKHINFLMAAITHRWWI